MKIFKILMNKTKLFLKYFTLAEAQYSTSSKRLAAEKWKEPWQTLLVTILSARNRDEVTIPTAEKFFKKFDTLEKIAHANPEAIKRYLRPINFFENKSRYIQETAKILLTKEIPNTIEELTQLPGVGRKTANLVLSEIHQQQTITVDTHVHRLSNVLGLVETKKPYETELQLMRIASKEYWSRINRIFVLWGKDCPGYDKNKLLKKIESPD
jgi:endonuclease III